MTETLARASARTPDPVPKSYDAIVVGTGPGGATVARELARRGRRVLMLEWGPADPVRGTATQFLRQAMIPGRSLLVTPELLGMVRGIATGGSSVFYYGCAQAAPPAMFLSRGVDLAAEFAEVRAELPVAPLPDAMMTPMATRLMEAALGLGLDWRRADKFMDARRWRPGMPFGYYGDPHGVKWSARMYVDDAMAHGATLLNGARVRRVLGDGRVATGVEYLRGGQVHAARAACVVVAAGGIGSPLILRASGIPEAGHDFFFDPLVTVCGTMKEVRLRDDEIPMSAGVHLDDAGCLITDLAVPPLLHSVFAAQVLRLDSLMAFRRTARLMVKIRDDLGGRLTDGGGIRKRLTAADRERLRFGVETATRVLTSAGATRVYRTGVFAAHPGGTVKLGELVDANLQTRIRGLHVCDCSVIPQAWGLPPTMTLVALGKRLARHLG